MKKVGDGDGGGSEEASDHRKKEERKKNDLQYDVMSEWVTGKVVKGQLANRRDG